MALYLRSIVLSLALLLAGCDAPATPMPTPAVHPPIRLLALGDSYTIGESVDAASRWPVQLAALLEARGRAVDLRIIARTGWTTGELWQAIRQDPPAGTYDLVTLLIGVNDEYRGGSPEQYRQDFRFLLGKAIGYAGGQPDHVVVVSIPDWGVTPYAQNDPRPPAQIAGEIDAFNAVNRDEAARAGARYVDVTPFSRTAPADPALLAGDGLHPSAKMYAGWVRLSLPATLSALAIAQ
jgi:lysophospholipase L1-like esterase